MKPRQCRRELLRRGGRWPSKDMGRALTEILRREHVGDLVVVCLAGILLILNLCR